MLVSYRVNAIFTDSITPFTLICYYRHREIGLALLHDRLACRLLFFVAVILPLYRCWLWPILNAFPAGKYDEMQKFESETGYYNGVGRLSISVALLVLNVSLAFPEHARHHGAAATQPGATLERYGAQHFQ